MKDPEINNQKTEGGDNHGKGKEDEKGGEETDESEAREMQEMMTWNWWLVCD